MAVCLKFVRCFSVCQYLDKEFRLSEDLDLGLSVRTPTVVCVILDLGRYAGIPFGGQILGPSAIDTEMRAAERFPFVVDVVFVKIPWTVEFVLRRPPVRRRRMPNLHA